MELNSFLSRNKEVEQIKSLRLNILISKILRKFARLITILAENLITKSLKLNPWTGLNKLDYRVAKLLPDLLNKDTFFIEVG